MSVRKQIRVSGVVQGVGFRPYVYRLATERNLGGSISNTPAGVTIEIQGSADLVEDFISRLPRERPRLAEISEVSIQEIPCEPDGHFEIVSSYTGEHASALISPDVAVCEDCLRELFDPQDRRYLYPFINCTNCGPRFTIVRHIPYDRARTSMSVFPMCPQCLAEYEDPWNRRFHAQPNACWDCGPQLALWDAAGRLIKGADPVEMAVGHLRLGEIIAVKGLGGFHLAVDALNSRAVEELRRRKQRNEKPFAIMVPDPETAAEFCMIDPEARQLLRSHQCPIVLLPRAGRASLAEGVAPRQPDLGIFLPYTPLHHLLFATGKFTALVMTSANLSEEPIAIDNREALGRLRGIADSFLVHNRDILLRCDDSVIRHSGGRSRRMRRARGYVPSPLWLPKAAPPILAVGGELKNTICLTRNNHAFFSQHLGDLENIETFGFFCEAIEHFSRILEIEPEIIAYDLHPDYLSTKWALAQEGVRLVGVQHHHAHLAACMAENRIDGDVIGVTLDGTGYGTDGHVWGGEVLVGNCAGVRRAAHFAYVSLPGSSAAIREPWRMAVSYLWETFGDDLLNLDIPFVRQLKGGKAQFILRMIERRANSPLTSSCGRLFDAVAALIGLRETASYEAQAAIELEALARTSDEKTSYPFAVGHQNECWQIGCAPLFESLVADLRQKVSPERISRRFHNGLAETLTRVSCLLRDQSSINSVCLSGGTFQNLVLLEELVHRLHGQGFTVFTHSEVPTGDGGLSLGQAVVAAQSYVH